MTEIAEASKEHPKNWASVSLGVVLIEGKIGLVRSAKLQHPTEGTPYIRMQHYNLQGKWNFRNITGVQVNFKELEVYELKDGDVLFNTRNSYELVGKVAIWPSQKPGYVYNNNLMRMRFPRDILPSWMAYQMASPGFRQSLESAKNATTSVCAIYGKNLLPQKIYIAPLNEQHRIVKKIETLTTHSCKAREALDAIPPLLDQFRQSVLAAAFRGDLTADWRAENPDVESGEELLRQIWSEDQNLKKKFRLSGHLKLSKLPESWIWSNLGSVGVVSGGLTKSKKRDSYSLEYPYLRVANVYADKLSLDEVKTIKIRESEYERVLLKKDDLLIVEGNGSPEQIGRVCIWDDSISPCLHQNHLIKVRFNNIEVSHYLLLWLLSDNARTYITQVASSSSGLHTLSISKVSALPVPIASAAEQKAITDRIRKIFSWIESLENIMTTQEVDLSQLDQSILAKAFRGQLVPQDPTDEPATLLLNRIRTERAKTQKTKKKSQRKKKS